MMAETAAGMLLTQVFSTEDQPNTLRKDDEKNLVKSTN